jgi:ABC-type methionine transport system ATPase subunit
MQVVKEICNKVAVMENGRVIERGDVIDIFNEPKAGLTRDFIRTATHVEQAEKNYWRIRINLSTNLNFQMRLNQSLSSFTSGLL